MRRLRRRTWFGLCALVGGLVPLSSGALRPAAATISPPETINPPYPGSGFASFEQPAMTGDGRFVAFVGQLDGGWRIGLRDRQSGTTSTVDLSAAGGGSDGYPDRPSISDDGRYVAFDSDATDLVAPALTRRNRVYVRDVVAGTTRLIGEGGRSALSADGRYLALATADSLDPGDTDGGWDVYRVDLMTGQVALVSAPGPVPDNSSYPAISADGGVIVFVTNAALDPNDTNGQHDVYVRDLSTGDLGLVSRGYDGSPANGSSGYTNGDVTISRDGNHVVFTSGASNLVAGDTNGQPDVFMASRNGPTVLVSLTPAGGSFGGGGWGTSPSVSADGRFVAFGYRASNGALPLVYVRDLVSSTTTLASVDSDGTPIHAGDRPTAISADGRFVAYTEVDSSPFNLLLSDLQFGAPTTGTMSGHVNAINPGGYQLRVGVCPAAGGASCPSASTPVAADGSYQLTLAAGSYVAGAYAVDTYDNVVAMGAGLTRAVVAGSTSTADLAIDATTPSSTELTADGNGDGTPDNQEPNVATVAADGTSGTVTVAAPSGTELGSVAVTSPASLPSPPPDAVQLAGGAISFSIPVAVGSTITVDVYVSNPIPAGSRYFKFIGGTWQAYAGATIVDDHHVQLTLTDGGAGDVDGAADGWIHDPGGIATPVLTAFLAPIDNGGVINTAKAGANIPVKWRLMVGSTPVSSAASFGSLESAVTSLLSGPSDAIESFGTGSGLQYLGNGYWLYNWRTPTSFKGQARTLTLHAGGATATAEFQFK